MEEDFDFEEQEEEFEGIDNEKHWKSLGIASAVISVISLFIIIAIIILTPSHDDSLKVKPFTFTEVITGKLIQNHRFNGTWISEYEFLYQSEDQNLVIYDCQHDTHTPITTTLNTIHSPIVDFELSKSRAYLLLVLQRQSLAIDNFECDPTREYHILNLQNWNMMNVEEEFVSRTNGSIRPRPECTIQSAEWAPVGDVVVLVVNNDIYRLKLENAHHTLLDRLTTDGSVENAIYNGIADYSYRELIFGQTKAYWWSVNGQYLCYLKLNYSGVDRRSIDVYPDDDVDQLSLSYHYPTINSLIGDASLWIIEFAPLAKNAIKVKRSDKLLSTLYYITYVDWTPTDRLVVVWTLRDQRRSLITRCDPANNQWTCFELASLNNWLPLDRIPHSVIPMVSTEANSPELARLYLLCGQAPETGVKAFYQLTELNANTKAINSYLNSVDSYEELRYYKITSLLGYNPGTKLVFFVGQSLSQDGELSEQDLRPNMFVFSIGHNTVHCLTCQLISCYVAKSEDSSSICIDPQRPSFMGDLSDDLCFFQSAHLSHGSKYAFITCLVGVIPKVYLIRFVDSTTKRTNHSTDIIDEITLFEENQELETLIETKMTPNVESYIITRELNPNVVKYLRLRLLTPVNFDVEFIGKYRLLFQLQPPLLGVKRDQDYYVEAYPDIDWALHMVTEHNFVFAWLDGAFVDDYNQSSSSNGTLLEELIDDYSSVVDFIQANFTFVNLRRSCLIGANVGGSIVLYSLSQPNTEINCGIAVAPIVNWNRMHTTITEQYLNWKRLKVNDLKYLLKVNIDWRELAHKEMLFVHGLANRLVPPSNTMQAIRRLSSSAQAEASGNWQSSEAATNESIEILINNIVNHYRLELFVNQGNSLRDTIGEHFYRKLELFLVSPQNAPNDFL